MAVISWDRFEGEGFFDLGLVKLPIPIFLPFNIKVEAVDQTDPKPIHPQKTGNIKETKGFYPKIISRKIGNPRVNEEDMGTMFHVKRL